MKKMRCFIVCIVVLLAVGGTVLAQTVNHSMQKQAESFSLKTFTENLPMGMDLSANTQATESKVIDQLQEKDALTLHLHTNGSIDTPQEHNGITVNMQDLTGDQYELLSYLLIPAIFSKDVLYDFAPPSNLLSEDDLCALRDDCYRLADQLNAFRKSSPLFTPEAAIPTQEGSLGYLELNSHYLEYANKLEGWAECYCPTDWPRVFEEEYMEIQGFLLIEKNANRDDTERQYYQSLMDSLDDIKASVETGEISFETGCDQMNDVWYTRNQ